MANSPVFVIKRIFTLIGLYLIGVIIGGVLQFVGIFHVGSNVPDYIFPSLIFIPSVTLLFFSSLKKKFVIFTLSSVALMAVFSISYKGVSFYKPKVEFEYNKYMGRYIHDNGIDTKGEIIILHTGSFSFEVKGYHDMTLYFGSGHLKDRQLIFDGNNSEAKLSGKVSGNLIKVHLWTSLYGDTHTKYYKTD
ncbi:MAG: hypothetical protein IPH93_09245 [Saprospiraceae bacterium]|nr:hypothetical protein [Saprospiraceae bacterium]